MPRVVYGSSAATPRRRPPVKREGDLRISGIYELLRDQERTFGGRTDPRWSRTQACKRGDPYPAQSRGPALLLPDLDAGEPVQIPWHRAYELALSSGEVNEFLSAAAPSGHTARFFWNCWRDRKIVGVRVYADDHVMPVGRDDCGAAGRLPPP